MLQTSVRKVRLFSLLLDGENTVSTWAVQRGQRPICSTDPSPQPTQEGLVRWSGLFSKETRSPRGFKERLGRTRVVRPGVWGTSVPRALDELFSPVASAGDCAPCRLLLPKENRKEKATQGPSFHSHFTFVPPALSFPSSSEGRRPEITSSPLSMGKQAPGHWSTSKQGKQKEIWKLTQQTLHPAPTPS